MPSSNHIDSSKKKEKDNKKNGYKTKNKSHTDVKKKVETNTEINNHGIKRSHTFNSKSKNVFISNQTIKIDDDNKYETILKKSKTLVFEKANTFKKFKAVLETIHEESDSKIDSSELSDFKEDIHKDNNINDNNGWNSNIIKEQNKCRLNTWMKCSLLKNYKLLKKIILLEGAIIFFVL